MFIRRGKKINQLKEGNKMIEIKKETLEGLPYCYALLIGTSPKDHLKAYDILDYLPKKGIIFTISRPADNLKDILKTKTEGFEIYFIDSISKSVGYKNKYVNTVYLDSPQSLTKINIAVRRLLKKHETEESFFILDSLSKLTFYHDSRSLFKFMNWLINQCRAKNTRLIILGIEDDLPKMLKDSVESMCDRVL